jgi:hypothetical protein
LIIQTIRRDPSGADQIDAEHQATDLAVGGSNPSRRALTSGFADLGTATLGCAAGRRGTGGAGEAHAHDVAQAAVGGQKPAGLLQVVDEVVRPGLRLGSGNARRCWSVLPAGSADPVEEGGRRCCISSAALRCVPYEDLQAEGYGAYRKLLNQAATTEGAKR